MPQLLELTTWTEVAVENFPYAVPVILRLASLNAPTLSDLPALLELAVKCVERFEIDLELCPTSSSTSTVELETPSAPHRSLTLHQRPKITSSGQLLLMVQMLWRVSMSVERKCAAWDKLTPRVILGRSIYGPQSSVIVIDAAEWARKQAVSYISQEI